ncbi:unnamed protein product [Gadus morhua 'NCC']
MVLEGSRSVCLKRDLGLRRSKLRRMRLKGKDGEGRGGGGGGVVCGREVKEGGLSWRIMGHCFDQQAPLSCPFFILSPLSPEKCLKSCVCVCDDYMHGGISAFNQPLAVIDLLCVLLATDVWQSGMYVCEFVRVHVVATYVLYALLEHLCRVPHGQMYILNVSYGGHRGIEVPIK